MTAKQLIKPEMKNYIAINSYRSSTSNGFSNTWAVYHCTRKDRNRILNEGLPVRDACSIDNNGIKTEVYSTMGISVASKQQIRDLLRGEAKRDPRHEIEWFNGSEFCKPDWILSV